MAGVANQQVERADGCLGLVNQCCGLPDVGQIGEHWVRTRPALAQLLAERLQRLGVATGERQPYSFCS